MAVVDRQSPAASIETKVSLRLRKFTRKYLIAYLFVSVPVIWSIVFLLIPMFVSLLWSFTSYDGLHPAQLVGLQNYIELFRDPIFIHSLKNTTIFVLLGMSIGPTLGLLTALMLNQNVRFQSLFRTAYFMPVMTSMVVVATIWIMLYNRSGILNTVLGFFGVGPIGWLSDPNWALFSVIIASIWQGFGFETVVYLAALQNIPKELYEAAIMDGAGPIQSFWNITLPSLRAVMLFIYIYGIIGSYQVFDQVYVMTQGGGGPIYRTHTLVFYLFRKFQDLRLGYASAIAYVLFIILLIFSYLQWRYFSEKE